jgi:hypothetical protein
MDTSTNSFLFTLWDAEILLPTAAPQHAVSIVMKFNCIYCGLTGYIYNRGNWLS